MWLSINIWMANVPMSMRLSPLARHVMTRFSTYFLLKCWSFSEPPVTKGYIRPLFARQDYFSRQHICNVVEMNQGNESGAWPRRCFPTREHWANIKTPSSFSFLDLSSLIRVDMATKPSHSYEALFSVFAISSSLNPAVSIRSPNATWLVMLSSNVNRTESHRFL